MPNLDLLNQLMAAGLIQFGHFVENGQITPIRLSLQYLPSYPHLCRALAEELMPLITQADTLLATPEVVSLASLISGSLNMPLIYSRGRGETAVRDLCGAYDVGHPTALITSVFDDSAALMKLVRQAASVGLEVQHIYCLIDLDNLLEIKTPRIALWRMHDVLQVLEDQRAIPAGQASIAREWLNLRRQG